MKRGRFITFEGGEGTGKSTQVRILHERLESENIPALLTREPGGSPGAELIRALLVEGEMERWDPLAEALLLNAARREHLVKTILPALEKGVWVLCDRFADSTLAYQGYGYGLSLERLQSIHALIAADLTPDLTLIFDMHSAASLKRTQNRSHQEDRYERMGENFHRRVHEGFLKIAKRWPKRCVIVDASQPVDTLSAHIWEIIFQRLVSPSHA